MFHRFQRRCYCVGYFRWLFLVLSLRAAAADWTTFKDPSGVSLEVPAGWQVQRDAQNGRVQVTGAGGEQVIIWPLFIPGPWNARSAPAVLQKLAESLGRKGEWGKPQPAGPNAVRMLGEGLDRKALCALTWVPSPTGSAAYVYVISAPPTKYHSSQPAFARIFQTFQIARPPAPSLQWVRWQDPREGAFSFEIPAEWRMQGGLARNSATDVRQAWELLSPDGDVRITGGDAAIPYHTEPNQMLAMAGFREGSWYSPGYGARFLVRRYIPGAAFAREYAGTRAAPGCAAIQITDGRDRPDAVSAINNIYAQYGAGINVRITAGEAAFTCQKTGRPMQGYCFAGTMYTQIAGSAIWNVEHLYCFLAAEGKAGAAQNVLPHVLQTLRINPQWMAMQQGLTANVSQIVSRTSNAISQSISSSYWSTQKTGDEISRRRSNAIRGVVDVADPATGREIQVENSSNYYWVDPRGAIVGTQTYTRPTIDFRELTQLP